LGEERDGIYVCGAELFERGAGIFDGVFSRILRQLFRVEITEGDVVD
jgi:hypothetical protein